MKYRIHNTGQLFKTLLYACLLQILYGYVVPANAQGLLEPVTFSQPGGFYAENFSLELTHTHPDAVIFYTLDGSIPDPNNLNGTVYYHMDRYRSSDQRLVEKSYITHLYQSQSPIFVEDRTGEENYFSRMQTAFEQQEIPYYFPRNPVFKGMVVRAVAVVNNEISSVKTHTYFVSPEGRSRFSLPVISLVVQENELFDYELGIYVPGKKYDDQNPFDTRGDATANHTQRGIDWERVSSF